MASIRKKSTSPFWFACYTREDGTRAQTSTKTTERNLAQRIADDLEQAHRRRITETQMRRTLSDLHERLTGHSLMHASLRDYAKQWLEARQRELKPASYADYSKKINAFVAFLGDKADSDLQFFGVADVEKYRDAVAARASARTARNHCKPIGSLFASAWKAGLIQENPVAKLRTLRVDKTKRRGFTVEEVKAILRVCDSEWRGMVLAGLYTGQRLQDLAELTWASVDLTSEVIRLRTNKTARPMEIPIAKPLLKHLTDLPAGDDPTAYVFPGVASMLGTGGNTTRLSQKFRLILAAAGLAPKPQPKHVAKGVGRAGKRERNEVSFHSLRHTATTLLKAAGAAEAVAKDIVGHESDAVSRLYTHIDVESKRRAVEKMPDVTARKGASHG